jgi:hypothetical protein
MVDLANALVAIYDGSTGGTKNCIEYADRKGLPKIIKAPVSQESILADEKQDDDKDSCADMCECDACYLAGADSDYEYQTRKAETGN